MGKIINSKSVDKFRAEKSEEYILDEIGNMLTDVKLHESTFGFIENTERVELIEKYFENSDEYISGIESKKFVPHLEGMADLCGVYFTGNEICIKNKEKFLEMYNESSSFEVNKYNDNEISVEFGFYSMTKEEE